MNCESFKKIRRSLRLTESGAQRMGIATPHKFLSARECALLLGMSATAGRTIRAWEAGDCAISSSAKILMRALDQNSSVRNYFGIIKKENEKEMIDPIKLRENNMKRAKIFYEKEKAKLEAMREMAHEFGKTGEGIICFEKQKKIRDKAFKNYNNLTNLYFTEKIK